MEIHNCLICMGSNTSSRQKIALARNELSTIFPDILFGKEMMTTPLFFKKNESLFCNQLGVFSTTFSIEEVKIRFRKIEKLAGRLPSDKIMEVVKLDIDLLKYDETILKPNDLQRDYIKKGLDDLEVFLNR